MIVLIHVINICETLPFHVLKILRCFFLVFFPGGSIKHLRVRFGVFFGFFCSFFLGGGCLMLLNNQTTSSAIS